MPGLEAFNRRWRVASDDLGYPAVVEVIVRSVWLAIQVIGLGIFHYQVIPPGCGVYFLLPVYYLGQVVWMIIQIVLGSLIAKKSMKGTIANPTPRYGMEKLLKGKFIVWDFELVWVLLGTYMAVGPGAMDDCFRAIRWIVRIMALAGWIMIIFTVWAFLAVYDSRGTQPVRMIEVKKKKSLVTCRALCWGYGEDAFYKRAFQEVALLMEHFFLGTDLVKTDIMAGMMLVHERTRGFTLPRKIDANHETDDKLLNNTLDRSQSVGPKAWMTLQKAAHFMKFAAAAYGKPFYTKGKRCGCCGLCSTCSPCQCMDTDHVAGDGCCQLNTAAVMRQVGLRKADIIYAAFYDENHKIPFYIAIDHKDHSVVVAIQGSTNMEKVLCSAQEDYEEVTVEDLGTQFIHKAIYIAAQNIKNIIEKQRLLKIALDRVPKYRLVVTGHSLGAGAASVLSLMLRDDYPELQCFAFSPPGWLISEGLRDYSEDFICSVVLGHDIVPRLDVVNFERFKQQILRYIRDCTVPKHQILATGCWIRCCGVPRSGFSKRGDVETGNRGGGASVDMLDKLERILKESEKREEAHFPLYMPGQVLYIEGITDDRGPNAHYKPHWTTSDTFDHIVVGIGMIDDHQPRTVLDALTNIAETERREIEAATLKIRGEIEGSQPIVFKAPSRVDLAKTPQATPATKPKFNRNSSAPSPSPLDSSDEPVPMAKSVPIASAPVYYESSPSPPPTDESQDRPQSPPSPVVTVAYKAAPVAAAVKAPVAVAAAPAPVAVAAVPKPASPPVVVPVPTYNSKPAASTATPVQSSKPGTGVPVQPYKPVTAAPVQPYKPVMAAPVQPYKPINIDAQPAPEKANAAYPYKPTPAPVLGAPQPYKPIGSGPAPYTSKNTVPYKSYLSNSRPRQTSSPKPQTYDSNSTGKPKGYSKMAQVPKSNIPLADEDSDSDLPEGCSDVLNSSSHAIHHDDGDSLDSYRRI